MRSRREGWDWFAGQIDSIRRENNAYKNKGIDILIVNGDAIDGRGEKSKSTELIATDQQEQCDIATECIEYVGAKSILMSRGTPYHTGKGEKWENLMANNTRPPHSHLAKLGFRLSILCVTISVYDILCLIKYVRHAATPFVMHLGI
jgi:hypothetical protein